MSQNLTDFGFTVEYYKNLGKQDMQEVTKKRTFIKII